MEDLDPDMPQPLSRVKKLKGRGGGPFAVLQRPLLASYVVGVITAWATTEVILGRILAAMLHADSSAAVKMYLSLGSSAARRDALRAAADNALTGQNKALFDVMMKAIKPVRELRNDFAHGLWGFSDDLPDALLWDSADSEIEKAEKSNKQQMIGVEQTLVYRETDMKRCATEAQEAVTLVHGIEVLIFPGHAHAHDATRQLLSTLPLLVRHGGLPTE